jgi:hypothetical protein
MTMLAGTIGHTFGVRVDGTSSRRFLRFLSLTALWAEGGGIALAGDEHKISVTGLVSMSYGMICILANQPTDNRQRSADSGYPPANACYPAQGTPKGISIQNTHVSMTWFSKSAAGVIVEGAGRKDVSFPIISFEEAYYGELQSL